jgi:hypothetical protein
MPSVSLRSKLKGEIIMEDKRAYSKAQFQALGIDTNDYKFNNQAGVFRATLDIKLWGNSRNLLAFFTLEDGRKVIASAPWFKEYCGLPDIFLGTKVEISYAQSAKGKVYLDEVRKVEENDCPTL